MRGKTGKRPTNANEALARWAEDDLARDRDRADSDPAIAALAAEIDADNALDAHELGQLEADVAEDRVREADELARLEAERAEEQAREDEEYVRLRAEVAQEDAETFARSEPDVAQKQPQAEELARIVAELAQLEADIAPPVIPDVAKPAVTPTTQLGFWGSLFKPVLDVFKAVANYFGFGSREMDTPVATARQNEATTKQAEAARPAEATIQVVTGTSPPKQTTTERVAVPPEKAQRIKLAVVEKLREYEALTRIQIASNARVPETMRAALLERMVEKRVSETAPKILKLLGEEPAAANLDKYSKEVMTMRAQFSSARKPEVAPPDTRLKQEFLKLNVNKLRGYEIAIQHQIARSPVVPPDKKGALIERMVEKHAKKIAEERLYHKPAAVIDIYVKQMMAMRAAAKAAEARPAVDRSSDPLRPGPHG